MFSREPRRNKSYLIPRRFMDITVIATTAGCASMANMLCPSLGSAVVGAVLGAMFGLIVSRPS